MRVRRTRCSSVYSNKIVKNDISANNTNSRFYCFDIYRGKRKTFQAKKKLYKKLITSYEPYFFVSFNRNSIRYSLKFLQIE